MRAYSSMSTSEFVNQLRDIAIRAGAKALVLDQLETLRELDPDQAERDMQAAVLDAETETMQDAQEQLVDQVSDTLSWLEGLEGLSDDCYKQIANRLEAFKVEL